MIETARLNIIPLNCEQLMKYVRGDVFAANNLHARNFPADRIEDVEKIIVPRVAGKTQDPLFITLWAMVLKDAHFAIGDIFFKGGADEKGEIEIAYGCYESFRGVGYMSEAIAGMLCWASEQKSVKAITAEVAKENIFSLSVLKKNGFVIFREMKDCFLLRRSLPLKRGDAQR